MFSRPTGEAQSFSEAARQAKLAACESKLALENKSYDEVWKECRDKN